MSSPKSSIAVVTLITGPEFERMGQVTLPSQRDYARRLGADFIILSKRAYTHPQYDKWQLGEVLDAYERCIYMDADAVVRPDCPDLSVIVPPEYVGGENELVSYPEEAKFLGEFAKRLGITPGPCPFYINTGVLVLSSRHRPLFRAPEIMPEDLPWPEQSHFNLRLLMEGASVKLFSPAFNDRQRSGSYLRDSFILHYSCMKIEERIAAAERDLGEWRRLFRRPSIVEKQS